MNEIERLQMIVEAVKYSQRVAAMGMPVAGYAKTLREAIYFVWTRRLGSKRESARFRSSAAVGRKWGRREIVYDHAIPFSYELKALMELSEVTPETVRPILEKYDVAAIITADEDARLAAAGLSHKMPDRWDGINTLARYNAAGIGIVENKSIPKRHIRTQMTTP